MTPDDSLRITKREQLRLIADRMMAAGACSAPLYPAAAVGQIALIQVGDPALTWPAETIARANRPTIVLLSGDPGWGEPSFGPGRWRCARKLQQWATGAIVHGAGGEMEHYRLAVTMAAVCGRLALIETTSSLAASWQAFLSPVPCLGILPNDNEQHPIAPKVRH